MVHSVRTSLRETDFTKINFALNQLAQKFDSLGALTGLADPTGTVGLTAVNGTASTAMRSDAAPPLSQAIAPTWTGSHIFNPASGNAITINTAAGTLNKAITATQSGPTGGSNAGPQSYNLLSITHNSTTTGAGQDGYGLNNTNATAFRVNMNATGDNTVGQAVSSAIIGLQITGTPTASFPDAIALIPAVYSNVVMPTHGMYAINPCAQIGASGSVPHLVGIEADMGIATGGTVNVRTAFRAASIDAVAAGVLDAAFTVGAGAGCAPWNKVIALTTNGFLGQPVATGGDFFFSESTQTIANIFNCSNITVSGSILSFPFVTLTGPGALTLNPSGVASPPTLVSSVTFERIVRDGPVVSQISGRGSGSSGGAFLALSNARTSLSSPTAVQADDLFGGISWFGYGATGYSTTSRARLFASAGENWSDTLQGSYITVTATPNGGTATAEVARFQQGLMVGTTTDPGAGLVNVATGYAISNDTFIERQGAANVRFGVAAAAAPVAQTLSVQNVVAGTSNTAGANWTLNGSIGTGTGAGGAIIFQTAPAGSTGTTQNALAEAMRIQSSGGLSVGTTTDSGAGLINAATGYAISNDTFFERQGAANFRFGVAAAAAAVAQTLSVQNVVAGTSNTAGANWTFNGSIGTGTGAGGAIVFQTAPAGSTGTAQNALAEAMRIQPGGGVSIGTTSDPGVKGLAVGGTVGTNGGIQLVAAAGASSLITVHANTDTTSGFSGIEVTNSTSAVDILFIANAPSRTTTRWGLTIGNWAEFGDFGSGNGLIIGKTGNKPIVIGTNNAERARIDGAGNVVISAAALATSATDGFLYIDSCAGTPTGVPTAYTGRVPIIYDTTNNKLAVYNGAWKQTAALT